MGTLIPLAPALAALGKGQPSVLADELQTAFSITVVGVLVGLLAFTVALIRERYYTQGPRRPRVPARSCAATPQSSTPATVPQPSAAAPSHMTLDRPADRDLRRPRPAQTSAAAARRRSRAPSIPRLPPAGPQPTPPPAPASPAQPPPRPAAAAARAAEEEVRHQEEDSEAPQAAPPAFPPPPPASAQPVAPPAGRQSRRIPTHRQGAGRTDRRQADDASNDGA